MEDCSRVVVVADVLEEVAACERGLGCEEGDVEGSQGGVEGCRGGGGGFGVVVGRHFGELMVVMVRKVGARWWWAAGAAG